MSVEQQLLFTETEVTEMLNVGRTTLRKFRADGELIPLKLGTAIRYRKMDVEGFIARKADEQFLRQLPLGHFASYSA